MIKIFFVILLIVDNPGGVVYNEHTSFTEIMGKLLYNPILKPIVGFDVDFGLIEPLSYFLFLWVLFKHGYDRSQAARTNTWVVGLLPLTTFIAIIVGLIRGGAADLSFVQTHEILLFVIWGYIGYFMTTSHKNVTFLFKLILITTIFKSIYALFVFFVIQGGTMGDREFLIDHQISWLFATALFYIIASKFLWTTKRKNLLLWISLFILILVAFILNDRRTSFLGMIITIGFAPFIIPAKYQRNILKPYVMLLSAFACLYFPLQLLLLFRSSAHQMVNPEMLEEFYRSIENYNLYNLATNFPILGKGFGFSFPLVIPLVDISDIYPLYNIVPHNTVLYMWAFAGPAGMAALGVFMTFGIASAVRICSKSDQYLFIIIGFIIFSIVLRWLLWAVFDLGIVDIRCIIFVGWFVGAAMRLQKSFVSNAR